MSLASSAARAAMCAPHARVCRCGERLCYQDADRPRRDRGRVQAGNAASVTPWTEIASVAVLGLGANTENLPVGLAYGLARRRIGLPRNLLIAAVTTAATLLPLIAGRDLRHLALTPAPDILGGLLLVALGLFNVWRERRGRRVAGPAVAPAPARAAIGLRETLVLAAGLSLNNIGLGFAGGIAGLGALPVTLSVAGFSVTLLWLGEWLSGRTTRTPGALAWLPIDGNLLLVAVGVLVMLGA